MSDIKNMAFAMINAWTTGEVESLADFTAPQFEEIDHPEAKARGLEGLKEKIGLFHKVHTRVRVQVHQQMAQGETVCSRWTLTATLRVPDDPSTAKPQEVQIQGLSWTEFAEGQIIRNRVYRDTVGYLLQRGFQWTAPGSSRAPTPTPAPQEDQA